MKPKNSQRAGVRRFGLVLSVFTFPLCTASCQEHTRIPETTSRIEQGGAGPQRFEVATIKLSRGDHTGGYSYSGGKVYAKGCTLKMLIAEVNKLQNFQIKGGPAWTDEVHYDIQGIPPDEFAAGPSSPGPRLADPQLMMLQSLLVERFGLVFHKEVIQGPVYALVRHGRSLHMSAPKDPNSRPYMLSPMTSEGFVNGELKGNNISMPFFAFRLGNWLGRPVIDRTGLSGSFDFDLSPSDPLNKDIGIGLMDAVSNLGLQLKGGNGSVETIVIDAAHKPTEN